MSFQHYHPPYAQLTSSFDSWPAVGNVAISYLLHMLSVIFTQRLPEFCRSCQNKAKNMADSLKKHQIICSHQYDRLRNAEIFQ